MNVSSICWLRTWEENKSPDTDIEAMKTLTPDAVAGAIGIPVCRWPGNCHLIACKMLEHKLVRGKSRYGHYHGFIHPDSKFGGRQFTHHGWIERRTTIVDPTRWVFECAEPYIYVGPKDDDDYDFGGNRLRQMMLKPPPPFNAKYKIYTVPKPLRLFVATMLGRTEPEICAPQVMWLANLPLNYLEDKATPLFEWIADDVGIPGFIPIDNRMEILGR